MRWKGCCSTDIRKSSTPTSRSSGASSHRLQKKISSPHAHLFTRRRHPKLATAALSKCSSRLNQADRCQCTARASTSGLAIYRKQARAGRHGAREWLGNHEGCSLVGLQRDLLGEHHVAWHQRPGRPKAPAHHNSPFLVHLIDVGRGAIANAISLAELRAYDIEGFASLELRQLLRRKPIAKQRNSSGLGFFIGLPPIPYRKRHRTQRCGCAPESHKHDCVA